MWTSYDDFAKLANLFYITLQYSQEGNSMLPILLFLMTITFSTECFDKVIIWGHKLHSHTHSYVHNAFYRAFKYMGYQTYWFDDNDNVSSFDFKNSLFITEGQVDKNIPIREDCRYILHYCRSPKYLPLLEKGYCIHLQVYNDFVLKRTDLTKLDNCIYYDLLRQRIYMPWATDLLPPEIDKVKSGISKRKSHPEVYWIGTIGGGLYGNIEQIHPFQRACTENNIPLIHKINVSMEENCKFIFRSYMAPAIVGQWQQEVGYIPCRIFKNISYGHMGVTNCRAAYELLEKKIVYNPDTYQLFYDAKKRIEQLSIDELYELMDLVKTKHTFINRIQSLLWFINHVESTYSNQ